MRELHWHVHVLFFSYGPIVRPGLLLRREPGPTNGPKKRTSLSAGLAMFRMDEPLRGDQRNMPSGGQRLSRYMICHFSVHFIKYRTEKDRSWAPQFLSSYWHAPVLARTRRDLGGYQEERNGWKFAAQVQWTVHGVPPTVHDLACYFQPLCAPQAWAKCYACPWRVAHRDFFGLHQADEPLRGDRPCMGQRKWQVIAQTVGCSPSLCFNDLSHNACGAL